MTGRDTLEVGVAGGLARHVPVLLDPVLDALDPRPGDVVVDGTFGAGGYSRAILDRKASVIAIDQDDTAIAAGRVLEADMAGRLTLVHGRFGELDRHAHDLGHDHVDGVVLDVGVSSMQLDQPERGFSFRADGPLDMRMGRNGVSAADVVNELAIGDLTRVIGILGEEKRAKTVAAAIGRARAEKPIARTGELAGIVEKAIGKRPGDRIHPATRTFQALRIYINRELNELAAALLAAERLLRAGGRLVVVAFHSLEDRIVKRFLTARSKPRPAGSRHLPATETGPEPTFEPITRKPIAASDAEAAQNPRARSARLRAARRTDADITELDLSVFGLPNLPESRKCSRCAMTRYFNIALLVAMIVAAAAVYDRKYDAEIAAEKVAELRRDIEREKDLIQHLKAEWAMLNQPARLQELVERYNAYLQLGPVDSEQIVRVEALPVRPMDLTPYQDGAGLGGYAAGNGTMIQ